jgi:hypothetical protein
VADWLIAITIGFSAVFMVQMISQQMGIYWAESIFGCQRWFFNPNPSVGCDDNIVDGVPERLLRDFELVELPSLKSKSQVAVPVGSSTAPASANNSQRRSDSFADDASASSLHSR